MHISADDRKKDLQSDTLLKSRELIIYSIAKKIIHPISNYAIKSILRHIFYALVFY